MEVAVSFDAMRYSCVISLSFFCTFEASLGEGMLGRMKQSCVRFDVMK